PVVAAAQHSPSIGPTEMAMPGSTGIELKPQGIGRPVGHPGTHPSDMNAMTKGCLAGTAVCFISHQGEVYPCGYLPALAGDLRKQAFADIWANSVVFNELRDTNNLEGKFEKEEGSYAGGSSALNRASLSSNDPSPQRHRGTEKACAKPLSVLLRP